MARRRIRRVVDDRSLTLVECETAIEQLLKGYKTAVKIRYIQNRYGTASSYYTMFQTLNGWMVFDPVSAPGDVTWFSA